MAQTDGYNSDIKSEQVQKLAELFPEAVVEGRVNLDALKAILGESIEYGEKYGLGWKGKSSVFAKIQEKTVSTLHPQPDESVDWDTTQNMFIEGDNLEALKVLHKAYYGKIKMIYIDPPYNTGNDFVYNDDFAKTRRQNAMDEGLLDEEGNATRDDGLRVNTSGHKHSNWLDMMYPRLFLARNLLRQDGVIFVSIDDNEVHNLRLMMNEIFGEENFVAQIVVQTNPRGRSLDRHIAKTFEYILVYTRRYEEEGIYQVKKTDKAMAEYNKQDDSGSYRLLELRNRNPVFTRANRPNLYYPIYINPSTSDISLEKLTPFSEEALPLNSEGKDGCWTWSRDKVTKNTQLLVGKKVSTGVWRVYRKDYAPEDGATTKEKSLWLETNLNHENGKEVVRELFGESPFDFPKSVDLIKRTLAMASKDDDIVADFFGGSGTFAHAVNDLNAEDGGNRKWIMVQLPELTDEKSEAHKAGYKTISNISRERIRRAGTKISKDFAEKIVERETPLDLGFRSYVLGDSNFKKWNEQMRDADEIRQATLDQLNPIEDSASDDDLLAEILLKRGISPLVEMETYEDFIFIPSETLAISLSHHMTEELFATILAQSPSQIILLDQAFRDDVNLKTNLILQAEKQDIITELL